ncbi:MAG: right-handed parallel beta-helix repeat-containing protein [Desulfuromonadales bacterium]|nr:right-handed parallel beta-helix repeat-containing protein [Desulfuromonadales bacterium]
MKQTWRLVNITTFLAVLSALLCCAGGPVDDALTHNANGMVGGLPKKDPGLPVFPGAQGFGAHTIAGRGGQIIKVTNLNDSGDGSFRQAVQTSGPRIIVFEVGGEIHLKNQLWITSPYVSIAGQTAPAPGIILSGTGLRVSTHDVLIQHIYVRHTANDGTDAIDIRNDGAMVPYNIMVDHVSVSWGDDENLSFNPGANNTMNNNVTFSNNLIAEGSGNQYGTLISDGTMLISLVGNLWLSHMERQPRIKGKVSADIVNNLSYNIGPHAHVVIGSSTGPNYVNLVGNLFLSGPNTPFGIAAVGAVKDIVPGSKIYMSDNLATDSLYNERLRPFLVGFPVVFQKDIKLLPSHLVLESVLSNAGARPGERDGIVSNGFGDPVDERLVNEVRSGTGLYNKRPPVMPVVLPTRRSFPVPANPNSDYDGDGYTNIEEILHQMAAAVE